MPSWSSKLLILREKEFNDFLNNVVYYKKTVSRQLIGATFYLCVLCDIKTVNNFKISWHCLKTNNFSNQNYYYFWKVYEVPKYYFEDVKRLIKILCISNFNINFKVQKFRNILQIYSLVVLQLYSNNVICLLLVNFWLRFSSYFILFNQLKPFKLKLSVNFYKINNISYGNKSVMEVDKTVKEINLLANNLSNGDKSSYLSSDLSDDIHSTVIKDNQIMIKTDYPQINTTNILGNNIDLKIKEEVKDNDGIKLAVNGEIITNCCDNHKEPELKRSTDFIEVSQTIKEVNNGSVKDNLYENNGEGFADVLKCEVKEKKSDDINNLQLKSEEQVRLSNNKIIETEKNKSREKDQTINNSSTNHISSSSPSSSSTSSSSKKYDSQSKSHQSSSSRHKYKDSRDDKYKSSSSNKNIGISSSSRRDEDKSKSDSRSRSRNCHHKPDEKCHCKSHHHSHHHSKKSKKFQSIKTQCNSDEIAFELRQNKNESANPNFTRVPWVPHPQLNNLKYGRFYRIEEDRNGGATVCHLYMDEISHLTEAQLKECAVEFIKLSYSEDENECAYHVMGIVHGAASYLPDLVDYMADHYPTLTVKTGSLASRDNHTTTMSQYRDEVYKTYSNGTFRYAPLDQLSICGVLGEEVGAYFPDFVARLEQSPFMKPAMPWSFLSVVQTDNPRESNDGPIFWVRPGEQMLPANEALKESARPKKRRNNELDSLLYFGASRSSEARESLFMDRTKAHADQVGVDYGISNTAPTAAVGVLKAVNCGHPEHGNRATKDVVAFHAQDYNELLEILMLDLYEPPQTQCTKWIEVSKLNTLRREGIRYAHLQLHDNDVYYLPRKIIHQFQTISSVASVAWHIRYRDYFSVHGAPNLHTPTGINKGQVFYEKKNVAIYCPPVSENDMLAAVTNMESGLKTPKKIERLKEYSPFKNSPRKMHKHQSPRSVSKKQSEPVPPQTNNLSKIDPEILISDKEKECEIVAKKRERSKSDDGRSSTDIGIKKSQEEESRKEKKSDSSHSRRSSGDHTPVKKERRNDESHSSHRKEVKNLDSEFSSIKKEKSHHEKFLKSKHDRKKNDDIKHNESSKRKERHEESSKSRSSSKHEKNREHGGNSHKAKTEEHNDKEGSRLKRKHEESPSNSQAKKIKEENLDFEVLENGKVSPSQTSETFMKSQSSENPNAKLNSIVIKDEVVLECKTSETEECVNVNSISESSDKKFSEEKIVKLTPANLESDANNQSIGFDLRQHVSYTGFINQISPFPPPPPPPLPSSSPPEKPPLPSSPPAKPLSFSSPPEKPVPPTSPICPPLPHSPNNPLLPSSPPVDFPLPPTIPILENLHPSIEAPQKDLHINSLQENCESSKGKSDNHVKKLKKKIAKKGNESYDLLGDIMSKMDKKK